MKDKFISMKQWINENEQPEREYHGCIMLDSKIPEWEEIHLSGIDPKDIYIDPNDDDYGLEENPHMTLLWGIHEDEIDPEAIMDIIEQDLDRVQVEIKNISIFENESYDVVKYEVPVTPQIQKYRNMLENSLPNTQTFPDFNPHITIAYVKPGEGSKYVKELDEPFSITFDKGVYSFHEEDDESGTEYIRKEFVFPDPEREQVDLESDESEITTPFTSDNE